MATPIGHRDDITLRALDVLKHADLIAAEDTRHTGVFLALHHIKNHYISYHKHNAARRTSALIQKLKSGLSIALVSNAGTPSVSDPGQRLIRAALLAEIDVVPIPGVSAAVTALSVSGMSTDAFVFFGFCDRKQAKRKAQLVELAREPRTMIFYESPQRIVSLLLEIRAIMGDRPAVLAREMTKRHEEFIHGRLSEIADRLKQRQQVRGECTLLIAGLETADPLPTEALAKQIRSKLAASDLPLAELSRQIAKSTGLPKSTVYKTALKIKKGESIT